MEILMVDVQDLKPYPHNPRKNDNAVPAVLASIREFGFKVPIIIDKNYEIVAGHTRLKAGQKLGLSQVPCIMADDLTEEQIHAFRLADNKTAELASWDMDVLNDELDALYKSIDMNLFGFAVQIENIDRYEKGEREISPELGETSDYVVLEFKTQDEWQRAIKIFDLKEVETPEVNEKIRRHGIGRVINGGDVLKRLEGSS